MKRAVKALQFEGVGGDGREGVAALTPIARDTVQTQVYRELRRALMHGRFSAGQVLTIVELARTLNTSTMPVRDALSRLVSEQALEALPNRSVRVPLIDIARLNDLRRARILIEGEALALAVPRVRETEIEAARQSVREYDAAIAARGHFAIEQELDANQAFHLSLYAASGSAILIPIIESLWLQSGPVIRAAMNAFDPTSTISAPHYHAQIVDALVARDADAARQALEHDISRAFDLLIKELDRKGAAS